MNSKSDSTSFPSNATTGGFHVDENCIDCDLCRAHAPSIFARDPESGLSYVHQQPVTPEDFQLAQEASELCPTDSIKTPAFPEGKG